MWYGCHARKIHSFPVRNNLTSQGISAWVTENLSYFRGRSHLAVMGVWKPLSGQIAHSFAQVYIWLSVWEFQNLYMALASLIKFMHVENWETDHLQHDLYVDISNKFTFVLVMHEGTWIIINTCRNDLPLVLLLIVFTAALPPTISSTHHYWHTSQIIKLLLLHLIFVTVRVTCTSYDVSICKHVSSTHVESPYWF